MNTYPEFSLFQSLSCVVSRTCYLSYVHLRAFIQPVWCSDTLQTIIVIHSYENHVHTRLTGYYGGGAVVASGDRTPCQCKLQTPDTMPDPPFAATLSPRITISPS